jgi:hypothetical protein
MSASEALSLYRALLRYSRQLTLTDKSYFVRRVRSAFDANRNLKPQSDEAKRQRDKARVLLARRSFL